MKILKNLENAKSLSKNENSENEFKNLSDEIFLKANDIDTETLDSELSNLKSNDLDYEIIHQEILENIIFDENDSGLSDFTDKEDDAKEENKYFDIVKIKNIINKSVASLFEEEQQKDEFRPLLFQEKNIKKNNEEISKENKNEYISNNTELKTQDDTVKYVEENNNTLKENTINKEDNIKEKEKEINKDEEIINFRKYNNYLVDPYSNFNNFTKKYEIKTNPKKRFRDIHPFLKTFNPKFLKKENIDKKIFRRFRKFVKILYKKNRNFSAFNKNPLFWKKFYIKNLLPPVKIILNHNGQLIEHKSFNTQYLIWLFNQEGTTELFDLFSKNESENVISNFIEEYDLKKSEEPDIIDKLKQYMKYIPEIYSSNNDDKIILEENKENFETNYLMNKDEDDLDSIESGMSSSNPFNLNFDKIEKKNFKEIPYDNNNIFMDNDISFHHEKSNDFNENMIGRNDSQFFKFKFLDDNF